MIQVEVEFRPGLLRQVVNRLLSLPAELRPSHHSLGEDEKGEPILDPVGFVDSLNEQSSPGPFLTGRHVAYDLRLEAPKPIICRGELDVDPRLLIDFMKDMASLNPIFGFACAPEERYRRNRVTVKLGVNTIESWVGRDTQRYVPGLYWLTLLSEELARRHCVPLSAVMAVAEQHIELAHGQHLFRFYERPEDWQKTTAVAELIAKLPGVFDVEKVKPQYLAARNVLELLALPQEW